MQKTDHAIEQIMELEDEAAMHSTIHHIHPLIKLLLTAAFLGLLVSFGKYDVRGVLLMGIYPFMVFTFSGVSFIRCMKKIWPVILFVGMFGIFDVFAIRQPAFLLEGIPVTYGFLSFFVLLLKGIYAVMAGYLLMATTGIENLCYAFRLIRVPEVLVTQILLTYRYLTLLIGQAGELHTAYRLRAPKERGIRPSVWGPMAGQLLLRTLDRAQTLYESMVLRGFHGSFSIKGTRGPILTGLLYGAGWITLFIVLRFMNITEIIGDLILGLRHMG